MKFTIEQGFVDELQALSIEVDARKNLIAFMLSTGMDISTEQFNCYQKEYFDLFAQFELLKNKLENEVIKPRACLDKFTWNLNYTTCEVTIEAK